MSTQSRTGVVAITALLVGVGGLASIPVLRAQRDAMQREANALYDVRLETAAALDSLRHVAERMRHTLALERARAASRAPAGLHLVIAVDSGTVTLMRDGIALRTMPARFLGDRPARGTRTISRISTSAIAASAPTVDSLGNAVVSASPERTVERVTLDDGTMLQAGDAAAAFLGGIESNAGPRVVVVSRHDFAAIRPNLTRGMTTVLF